MTDNRSEIDEKSLETLFESARRVAPEPDAAFLDRLTRDMEDNSPTLRSTDRPTSSFPALMPRIQGFLAASGLTGAALLGVWIGFVMPDVLNTLAAGYDVTEASGIEAFLPAADLAALNE